MSETPPRLLVASTNPADAELVERLLRDEFSEIGLSCDPRRAVEDFEQWRPDVLILAFNSLEKAENYYLGLYRLCPRMHELPHRTVILCNKDDLRRVYELCRREYFDDYVLFWPIGYDGPRLLLSVHQALRRLRVGSEQQLAQQAARLAQLESLLKQQLAEGGQHLSAADRQLQRVEADVDQAVELFIEMPDPAAVGDRHAFRAAVERLRRDGLDPPIKAASAATRPLKSWIEELPGLLAPQLESARALGALARARQPQVLMVEDDAFQHRLLRQLLRDAGVELAFASDAGEAMALVHKHAPALILMDINLPDVSGVELTRRIKAIPALTAVPVVMITGDSSKANVIASRQAGAVDFVAKPFEREVLLGKLRRYLGVDRDSAQNAAKTPGDA